MKYFRCYYHDSYRCENTVCIARANNVKEVRAALQEKYSKCGMSVSEWKIEEIEFSDSGLCEVYYH